MHLQAANGLSKMARTRSLLRFLLCTASYLLTRQPLTLLTCTGIILMVLHVWGSLILTAA